MDRNLHAVLLVPQISIDLALASLQAPQLIAYGARVAVTPCYEIEAAFNAALDILQLFYQASPRPMPFLSESGQFALELSREFVDEQFVSEENIPQPVQHALF